MVAYLTDKNSIGGVIAAMTLEEKALLLTGKSKIRHPGDHQP